MQEAAKYKVRPRPASTGGVVGERGTRMALACSYVEYVFCKVWRKPGEYR